MNKILLAAGILLGMGIVMTIIAAAHAIGAGIVVFGLGAVLLSRITSEPKDPPGSSGPPSVPK